MVKRRRVWQTVSASSQSDDGVLLRRQSSTKSVKPSTSSWQHPASDSGGEGNGHTTTICKDCSSDEGAANVKGEDCNATSGVLVAGPGTVANRSVTVELNELIMLCKVGRERQPHTLNHYETQGCDEARIQSALSSQCGCRKKCFANLDARQAHRVCHLWHSYLTSSERKSLLHHLVHIDIDDGVVELDIDEDSAQKYFKYMVCGLRRARGSRHPTNFHHQIVCVGIFLPKKLLFEGCLAPLFMCSGVPVCRKGLEKLLGIHPRYLTEAFRGKLDGRLAIPGAQKPKAAPQTERVHEFFLGLYKSAAEPLPHEKYMVRTSIDRNIEFDEAAFKTGSGVSGVQDGGDSDDEVEVWNPDASVIPSFASFLGRDIGVQKRYLTHSTVTSLYWLMLATIEDDADDQTVPSMTVFHTAWHTTWRKFLGFRKVSQHSECKACFAYRQQMQKKYEAPHLRMNAAREWRLHLRSAYHDRLIYWWCRYASRHSMDVLTIIIDSMDKAKFAWPQYPWGRTDKTLHSFRRPRLVVTGAFAHGFGTFLFIADDNLSHGSCAFCDVLCRVLESVWAQCKRRGIAFPKHLVVQSDNTTAQAKNTYVAMFLAYLVSRYKFATTNLFFLMVGHTHEDIGLESDTFACGSLHLAMQPATDDLYSCAAVCIARWQRLQARVWLPQINSSESF